MDRASGDQYETTPCTRTNGFHLTPEQRPESISILQSSENHGDSEKAPASEAVKFLGFLPGITTPLSGLWRVRHHVPFLHS
jgi:hypothetical protein